MPQVLSNGIELAYETHGNADDATVLLVMGLGMPLTAWPPGLIDGLVSKGFRVITFDNRDVGQSQQMEQFGTPNILFQFLRQAIGFPINAPYDLADMAQDTIGLLDELDIERAHVVGVSMGGMISQLTAIQAPHRVASLTSIMSTTGNPRLPGPTPAVRRHMLRRPPDTAVDAKYRHLMETLRLIGSPAYPTSDQYRSEFIRRNLERGMSAAGVTRQLAAIMASGNRVTALRKLTVPTLVIHGNDDPLIPVECGHDTANAIPNAEMAVIPGMGHTLPEPLLAKFSAMITKHAKASG